jgi:transcriptional accessory protein Tex/SPT6
VAGSERRGEDHVITRGMGFTTTIDLAPVAHGLSLPLASVETVVRLLDAGNTVPFITRYRKDQTGGLDEEQIRDVESRVGKLRLLAERKQTILRSIDSQGKLTDQLAKAIHAADSTKRLEDLYLPFKPKKQTLATVARERQLEPLAAEILSANEAALDLDARARDFVNTDKQVNTPADALLGVGHILAEDFSERADLRDRLRKILKRTGKLVSTRIESEEKDKKSPETRGALDQGLASGDLASGEAATQTVGVAVSSPDASPGEAEAGASAAGPHTTPLAGGLAETPSAIEATRPITSQMGMLPAGPGPQDAESAAEPDAAKENEIEAAATDSAPDAEAGNESTDADAGMSEVSIRQPDEAESLAAGPTTTPLTEPVSDTAQADTAAEAPGIEGSVASDNARGSPARPQRGGVAHAAPGTPPLAAVLSRKEAARREREAKKAKQQDRLSHEFRDYFSYQEQLSRIPPHRVLAINRGERAKILRVKIESDTAEMTRVAEELLIPHDHPHAEFLRGCARDALARLVIPSLEREVRRELTENAETHAVEVFAKNLRNLLLQPPVHGRRVMALDPGFKSGCKLAVLDEFGHLLDHSVVHLIGKTERKQEARAKIIELVRTHSVKVLAIGNGTACRETEEFVADILGADLKDDGVAYVIVNEAGASVYSTSPLGREELPQYDATLRGAISIGRRLQDPLSELVKIDPANIGVGMYQHDVKAKHLRTSLDAVVESCVNYVGVDLNTASPALLRYVSGLNQLTARRLYDYRTANGPLQRREQLKEVPGFGEATYVQAAGFLKITGGDQPLDATWIHPESYEVAQKVLARVGRSDADLAKKDGASEMAELVKALELAKLADELQVGQMTLADIVSQFTRPGRDPREDLPEPIFKRGILKLDDLQPGMELSGSVLNVVDFGAFVDIGLHDSGLVHVSQLANRYVRDPHEVVSVGDIVKVWVMEIDKTRRRVSLTMIPPGTKKPEPHFRRGKPERRPQGQGATPGEGRPRSQAGQPGTTPQAGAPGRERRPPKPHPVEGGAPQQGDRGEARRRGQPEHLRPYGSRPAGAAGRGSREGGQRGGREGGVGDRRSGDRARGGGSGRGGGAHQYRPKPPAKPLPPITKKMIEGKEPMRTFGDLMQFMKVKQAPEPGDTPAQRKNGDAAATAGAGSAPTSPDSPSPVPTTEAPEPESSAAEAPSTAASETQQRMAAVPAPHSVSHSEHAAQPAVESQAGQPTIP